MRFLNLLEGEHQASTSVFKHRITSWFDTLKEETFSSSFLYCVDQNPHTSTGLFHPINHHNWAIFIQKEKESYLNDCHCQSLFMVDSEAARPRLWWCPVPAKKFHFYYNIEGPRLFLVCFQSSQRMADEYSENTDLHHAGPWKSSKSCLYLMKS